MNQKIYDKAIALLNIRMHTTGELYQKLKLKGFKPDEIQAVLRQLEEQRFLDDQKFAEIFVENMKRYKDWGYYGIKSKLMQKHIPSELAAATLSEFFSLADEEIIARRLIGKLQKQGRSTFDKLTRSLHRRGFRNEIVRKTFREGV